MEHRQYKVIWGCNVAWEKNDNGINLVEKWHKGYKGARGFMGYKGTCRYNGKKGHGDSGIKGHKRFRMCDIGGYKGTDHYGE